MATLNGNLELPYPGQVVISAMHLRGDDVDAVMDLGINTVGNGSLVLDAVVRRMGDHSLNATLRRADLVAPIELTVDATRFDLRGFIGPQNKDENEKQKKNKQEAIPPIDLDVVARDILLLNGEHIRDAKARVSFREGEPKFADIDGVIGIDNSPIQIKIEQRSDAVGDQRLSIISGDAGGVLRGMGYFAHVIGGRLEVEGSTSGWGDALKADISTKVRRAQVLRLSELGDEIIVGGIEATNDFIDEGGIELRKADVTLTFSDGLLDFSDVIANGPRIGITLEGQIHAERNKININGIVVPAYGLNSLLGNIPLLGTILTGGEGEGIFAVPYRVKGNLTKPEVDVSRASALAPGILRKLFQGSKGTIADVDREEAKAAQRDEKESDKPGRKKKGGRRR